MIPALFFGLLLICTSYADVEAVANTPRNTFPGRLKQLAAFPGRCAIGFYKFFISEQDLSTCNFEPTCSTFSMQAYKTTDPLQATFMMFDRLTRCNYWVYGEYTLENGRFIDPVTNHMIWGSQRNTYRSRSRGISVSRMKPIGREKGYETDTPYADLEFADAMARAGETELALEEYSRLSGDAFSQDIRIDALFHGGWVLFESDRFADAAATFEEAQFLAGNESDETLDAALLVLLALISDNHRIDMEKNCKENPAKGPAAQYISAWGTVKNGDFTEAHYLLKNLEESSDEEIALASAAILADMDSLEKPVNKKGWIAGSLSALLPGLGRVYTGRYGDAVFSSLAAGGTAGLAVRAVKSGPWTKSAFFISADTGFYLGNIYGSIISARSENNRSRQRLFSTLYSKAKARNLLPKQIIVKRLAHRLPPLENTGTGFNNDVLALQALNEANSYYYSGQWQEAIRSFRRYFFFAHESSITDSILFRLGKSLEYSRENEKACKAFEKLLDELPESELDEETRLALARLHFRNGDHEHAGLELDEEMEYGDNRKYLEEAAYLKTWVFLNKYDWDGALSWLENHSTYDSVKKTGNADSIIRNRLYRHNDSKYKSPRLARCLSAVIPGLGQAYAGKPLNGAGALLINGVIIYSMVHSVQSENWLDLGLITGLLFHRFYMGNLYNAERFSQKYNNEQNERFIKSLKDDVRSLGISFDPHFLKAW